MDYLNWCENSLYPFMSYELRNNQKLELKYDSNDTLENIFKIIDSDLNSGNLNSDYNVLAYGATAEVLESLLNSPNGDFI